MSDQYIEGDACELVQRIDKPDWPLLRDWDCSGATSLVSLKSESGQVEELSACENRWSHLQKLAEKIQIIRPLLPGDRW